MFDKKITYNIIKQILCNDMEYHYIYIFQNNIYHIFSSFFFLNKTMLSFSIRVIRDKGIVWKSSERDLNSSKVTCLKCSKSLYVTIYFEGSSA